MDRLLGEEFTAVLQPGLATQGFLRPTIDVHMVERDGTKTATIVVNPGTLYPTLLKLEQEGWIISEWGVSDNNRRARFYRLTRAGRGQLERATRDWELTTKIVGTFLAGRAR